MSEPVDYTITVGSPGAIPIYMIRTAHLDGPLANRTYPLLSQNRIGEVHLLADRQFQIQDPDHSLYGTIYPTLETAAMAVAEAHAQGAPGRDPSHFAFGPVQYDQAIYRFGLS